MGFIRDTLQGKEKKIKADPLAGDINNAARSGVDYLKSGASRLNDIYSQDPTEVVNAQISMENKVARTAADDAIRRTQSLISQRGLGNSSIGLGAQVNQERSLLDKLAMNKASGISRLRDMSIENGMGQINAGNSLFNLKASQGPIQLQDQKYRTGGYGELIVQGGRMAAAGSGSGG
jgi:hypothetical protein